jgi:iron-sulfur cluster assembly protein
MITLTQTAAGKLQHIMTEKGLAQHALRVFVSGGGCSGLSYGMTFSEGAEFGDQEFEINGVKVVVDMGSIQYLDGAEIDYIDSLMGGGFRIEIPMPSNPAPVAVLSALRQGNKARLAATN